jgi:hypothetical protein
MEFKEFRQKLKKHFEMIVAGEKHLFLTDVSRDELWNTYLESFPPGTNNMFRKRREYDCKCCKQFIHFYSNLILINNKNEMVSIWDIPNLEHPFDKVAEALSKKVKAAKICNVFVQNFPRMGVESNLANEDGTIKRWEHLHLMLPKDLRKSHPISVDALMGELRSRKDVFHRALSEITEESINTVLELIEQNSLYRGAEYKGPVSKLLEFKKEFNKIKNHKHKDNFSWRVSIDNPLSECNRMETYEIDYFGTKIFVQGNYYPGEEGTNDVPPSPDSFDIEKITVERSTDISEFLDLEKIKETILNTYYER